MPDDIPHCLALYLDAPLQSWGYQSRFDRRTSFSFPTRSGVTGMICAAMGIDRSNEGPLEQFRDLKMTMLVFQSSGRLTDFHTVGGGWDKKSDPGCIVKTAQGKIGATVITRREYLQDARFGVVVTGPLDLLKQMEEALQNPRWGIWLGRKSCIPATPVCQGIFADMETARARLSDLAGGPDQRSVEEADCFEDGSDTLNDMPLSFAERHYAPRRIRI